MSDRSLALITAVYGAYDGVKPAPRGFDECVLVTDRQSPRVFKRFRGWNVVRLPMKDVAPRVAAKVPKCRPDWFTGASASVWVDGSFRIRDERFAEVARSMLSEDPLSVSDHPESVAGPTWKARNCFYDEAAFSAPRPKYRGQPVVAQAEHYLKLGMPREWGLWALGIIARRHTQQTREFGLEWLLEIERWTVQDQVSFPYLLWKYGIRPSTWPFHQLRNDLVEFVKHSGRDDSRVAGSAASGAGCEDAGPPVGG